MTSTAQHTPAPAASTWSDAWLTPTEARAARNAAQTATQRPVRTFPAAELYRARRARARARREVIRTAATVALGALGCIAVVALLALELAYFG